ncbi:hypothetical protein AWB71_02488 [Caballeronia peredens]|nr:hypothetical protein AWB71_02488 [Caballeronia peredens]
MVRVGSGIRRVCGAPRWSMKDLATPIASRRGPHARVTLSAGSRRSPTRNREDRENAVARNVSRRADSVSPGRRRARLRCMIGGDGIVLACGFSFDLSNPV